MDTPPADAGNAGLLAVNQALVLAMLRMRTEAEAAARASTSAATVARQLADKVHKERYALLAAANEQLVLAAVGAHQLREAAQQAQERQTTLMALVAHELRHPLAPMRTAVAVLGRLPEQPPMVERMRTVIERQVAHMARLVNDLLDTTRASTGKLRIELQRIDLMDTVEEALRASQPAMQARAQQFTGPPAPLRLPMDGDAMRLMQVLSNLLDNASKYTPHGGRIALDVSVQERTAVISVSDSGIGITAETLERVFEPFVQEVHATAFNGVGLGLGLTVVREIVQSHGGSVAATSGGAGKGSRFTVLLPLADDAGGPAGHVT